VEALRFLVHTQHLLKDIPSSNSINSSRPAEIDITVVLGVRCAHGTAVVLTGEANPSQEIPLISVRMER
jgi:hypothetical protein